MNASIERCWEAVLRNPTKRNCLIYFSVVMSSVGYNEFSINYIINHLRVAPVRIVRELTFEHRYGFTSLAAIKEKIS